MRLTIIKVDNTVYIDGLMLSVDCSALPPEFWALQWYDTYGDLEQIDAQGGHVANVPITDLTPYQSYIDSWNTQKAAYDAAIAAAAAAAAAKAAKVGTVNVIAS